MSPAAESSTYAGGRWLLNLEDLQTAISGADEYVLDLARYLAADIAVNPWASGVRLDCIGVAEEVAAMNPARAFGPYLARGDFDHFWIYLAGPIAGMILGALAFRFTHRRSEAAAE